MPLEQDLLGDLQYYLMKQMNKQIAFIFPGQGAQYPGMGKDFFDQFKCARDVFAEADQLLGYSFSKLIFNGPADELTLTKNSQLAIFITSIAMLRVLEQETGIQPTVCAGLSLGEYTALVAASKISFKDCLFLVKARAELMHECCVSHPGTMYVVLGLDADAVEQVIKTLKPSLKVWVANLNCPGQVVIAGTKEDIEKAAIVLKEKSAKRCLPLEVSGAFHSGLMENAKVRLSPLIQKVAIQDSNVSLVMNVIGGYVSSSEHMRRNLIDQVTHSVRWEQGVRAMMAKGVNNFIEIGPGKTLTGMNRKIGAGLTLSLEKVTDLPEIIRQLEDSVICNC